MAVERRQLDILKVNSLDPKPVRSWTFEGMLLLETDTLKLFQLKGGAWVPFVGSDGTISADESDPIFQGSPAFGITGAQIANWDAAFGWGNWATGVDKPFVDALGVNAGALGGLARTGFGELAATQTWTGVNTFQESIGIGASPSFDLHIQQPSAIAAVVVKSGLSSSSATLRLDNDLDDFALFQMQGSTSSLSRWGVTLSRWAEFRAINVNGFAIGTSSAAPVRIGTDSVTAILIDISQQVCIGTVSPTEKLDVDGNTRTRGYLDLDPITAPAAPSTGARQYVDAADGDLKVIFANGTVKTLATN